MSIPASMIIDVTPSVLGAGGNPLGLNGLLLTDAEVLPVGDPVSFVNAAAVGDYFGYASQEYKMAPTYFEGYDNSTQKPGSLLFSRWPQIATAGWLRSQKQTLTLAETKAIKPATASSCTIASGIMTTSTIAGTVVPGMLVTGTGVPTGVRVASGTSSPITLSDLTVNVVESFAMTAGYDLSIDVDGSTTTLDGSTVDLSSATSFSDVADTLATLIGNSTDGTYASNFKAYTITSGSTGANSAVDTATGFLADTLGLALGTVCPGSDAVLPAAQMDLIILVNSNWANFGVSFEVDTAPTVYTVKLDFAAWASASNGRFMYVASDQNSYCVEANGATVLTLGQALKANSLSGTASIFCDEILDSSCLCAAFVLGSVASIDYAARNGRIVLDGKSGSGVPYSVQDAKSFTNLIANNTSAYASFATANQIFNFFVNGFCSGDEAYIDNYVDAIYLDAQCQLALMVLKTTTTHIPFTNAGATILRHALEDPIDEALNNGTITPGVALSPSQAATVNAAAGAKIDKVIESQGYYLGVPIPSAQIRNARGPWPMTLWYTNGEGLQTMRLATVNIR